MASIQDVADYHHSVGVIIEKRREQKTDISPSDEIYSLFLCFIMALRLELQRQKGYVCYQFNLRLRLTVIAFYRAALACEAVNIS